MDGVTNDTSPPLASPGTLVLLGAGASAGAGFPTSLALHGLLLERLGPIYANLAGLVFPDGRDVDPERLLRVMEFLSALETSGGPPEQSRHHEAADIAALIGTWHPDIDEYLNSRRRNVRGSALQRAIDQLWKELVDIFTMNAAPIDPRFDYLAVLASCMRGQAIVTLNYDDALDHMPGRAMTFQIDSSPTARPVAPGFPANAVLRLIKLHGSLDWRRDNSTGDVEAMPYPWSYRNDPEAWNGYTPGVIFGAGNKLRPDGPYLALYQEFLTALSKARQVIVIGYSFRDAHVNEALRRWVLEQAQDDDLLRIGCLDKITPLVVESWVRERDFDVEIIPGRAEDVMGELLAPRPRLSSK
jgi:hypothetical protein